MKIRNILSKYRIIISRLKLVAISTCIYTLGWVWVPHVYRPGFCNWRIYNNMKTNTDIIKLCQSINFYPTAVPFISKRIEQIKQTLHGRSIPYETRNLVENLIKTVTAQETARNPSYYEALPFGSEGAFNKYIRYQFT